MDKEDMVRIVTTGVQEEIFREAWAMVEEAMKQAVEGTKATLTQDERDAVDLGIHAGINATCTWLIKHKLLPGAPGA